MCVRKLIHVTLNTRKISSIVGSLNSNLQEKTCCNDTGQEYCTAKKKSISLHKKALLINAINLNTV